MGSYQICTRSQARAQRNTSSTSTNTGQTSTSITRGASPEIKQEIKDEKALIAEILARTPPWQETNSPAQKSSPRRRSEKRRNTSHIRARDEKKGPIIRLVRQLKRIRLTGKGHVIRDCKLDTWALDEAWKVQARMRWNGIVV